jgi:hypothetical protein
MPVTPTRKVAPSGSLSAPRATAASFGGLEAQALSGMGNAFKSLGQDIEDIQNRNDTFVAQKGYNEAHEWALNGRKGVPGAKDIEGYNALAQRNGEAAIGSSTAYAGSLGLIAADITKDMTPRQQRIFMQNWKPKELLFKQRASQHEQAQVESAQIQQMQLTAESQLQEWVDTSSDESLKSAENSFRAYMKRNGSTKESIDLAWEKTLKSANDQRFDKFVKAEEFGAALNTMGLSEDQFRPDGTLKEQGFLGEQKLPGGGYATEYSIGVRLNGVETDIPTLVPTLTEAEREIMVGDIIPHRKPIPDAIVQKAVDHAEARQKEGKPVFWSNETDGDGAPALSNDQKIKLQILDNAKISQQRRLEAEANERTRRGDARIQEKIVRSGDPLYQPPLQDFINDYGDPVIGKAMYDRYAIELEEIKKKNLPPRQLTPDTFASAIDMATNPGKYTYTERMVMAYNLNNLKADDPGVASLLSQINSTFTEKTKTPFLSPTTRSRNGHYLRIFSSFSKAHYKGRDAFTKGPNKVEMSTTGTVTTTGEASLKLGEWLDLYDRTVEAAEKKGLDPSATDKLLNEVVFAPLQYMADKKMTRETNNTWLKAGMDRLQGMNNQTETKTESGIFLPEGTSEEDRMWLEGMLKSVNEGAQSGR